ncbi:MAG: hypothetical protein O6943_08940 [Bacteroidetes bacterium]|nr:hypothetical protein [Bacteroidota bacterium]
MLRDNPQAGHGNLKSQLNKQVEIPSPSEGTIDRIINTTNEGNL